MLIIPRTTTRVTDFLGEEWGQKTVIGWGGGGERGVKIDESIRDVERKDRNGFPKVKVTKI